MSRSPRGRKGRSKGSHPKAALPVTEKAPEQSGLADAHSDLLWLVWGPGAGVEAAGGLCLSHNEAGVVCRPRHTGELYRRERLSAV
jgi:hypothetical protein